MLQKTINPDMKVVLLDNHDFYNGKEKWLKNLNYDKFEAHRLQNWALVKGKYYYVKQQRVLNEQVGEALAKKMWLPTSHNILGIKNGNIVNMSENFKEPGKTYCNPSQIFSYSDVDKLQLFKRILKTDNYEKLENDILKMYAIDIYMRQMDRADVNILFEKTNEGYELAPLYDYTSSMAGNYFKTYYNGINDIDLTKANMDKVFNMYPRLRVYLDMLSRVDLAKIVDDICNEYKLINTGDIKEYYKEEQEKSVNLIKSIL